MKQASSLLIGITLVTILLLSAKDAYSDTMQNSNYILKTDQFSTFKKQTIQVGEVQENDLPSTKINSTIVESEKEEDIVTNLQNTPSQIVGIPTPLRFTTETNTIDFGELNPGEPVIRQANITIQGGSPFGYQILSYEDSSLTKTDTQETIPDTTCDTGICTQTTPGQWKNPLTFGFGYSCQSKTKYVCINDNEQKDELFLQFSNRSENELPQPILRSFSQLPTTATLIYKVNIPPTQSVGKYSTTIHLIATPIL